METPEESDENPPLELLLEGTMVDDTSPEVPSRATRAGLDEAGVRREFLARLRRGELSLRERAAALMLGGRLDLGQDIDALEAIVRDRSRGLGARSVALAMLLSNPAGPPRVQAAALALGDAEFTRLSDEKLVLELVLQLPAPGLADGLARALLGVPAPLRDGVFARLERCRRRAGLLALVAWRRALCGPELAAFHDRMAAAVIDEAGEGSSVALEMLWQGAPDDASRRIWGRIVAALAARQGRKNLLAVEGSTHRVETPGEPTQWMVCIAHPERMTMVAKAREREGTSLEVEGVYVMPSTPSVSISGGEGPITLSYRVMSLEETRERAVKAALAMRGETKGLPHDLCLLLCLLDGMPAAEPASPASAAS